MAPSDKLTLALTSQVTLDFVYVLVGEFLMGSDPFTVPGAAESELPQHRLFLDAYFISRTPVTVRQFDAFVQSTEYKTTAEQIGHGYNLAEDTWQETKNANWRAPHGTGSVVQQKSTHPVTLVSWYDAQAFCAWVTTVTQRKVHLPSEAEWERAARGADGFIYPWGNTPPTAALCNFDQNVKDTTPVGRYSPKGDSPVGCVDMAGNVMEWTRSLWGENLHIPEFKYPYSERGEARENVQAADIIRRIVRGGAWDDDHDGIRAACRIPNPPIARNDLLGFRVAAAIIKHDCT